MSHTLKLFAYFDTGQIFDLGPASLNSGPIPAAAKKTPSLLSTSSLHTSPSPTQEEPTGMPAHKWRSYKQMQGRA
jgi:hypothetical protein